MSWKTAGAPYPWREFDPDAKLAFTFDFSDFAALAGGTPAENAATTRAILSGEPGPKRDLAVINAGAAIYAGGRADSLADGV